VGAELVEAEWTTSSIEEVLSSSQPSAVFALLGTTRRRMKAVARGGGDPSEAGYAAVDRDLTLLLLGATRAVAPDARFVYLSALGVSQGSRAPYMRVRWEVERALQESGQPFAILQPGFITGADRQEDRPGERWGAWLSEGGLSLAATLGARSLREKYRSHPGAELARALAWAGWAPEADASVLQGSQLRR
jgi:hypothetical protein